MPLESSPEQPLPVRTVARAITEWVGRLGRVWVEGQVTQLTARPGQAVCFLVLRDPAAEMSLQVVCQRALLDQVTPPPTEGSRVVVWARPEFRPQRGTLSLTAFDLRPVGVGALLARLEQLRVVLAAEGLFAPARKQPLPFLPRTVGLVTGRASAAERDVVDNARGGGSVEDLLPFSDEALVRAVAGCRTPVVTAIGHESDTPLVDHAADRRASTPTDAAKLVVPDVAEEQQRLQTARGRARRCVEARLAAEQQRLDALRSRPALADPRGLLDRLAAETAAVRERARRAALGCVGEAGLEVVRLSARVTALSPQATLDRGYAVLQRADGAAVRSPSEVEPGDRLVARVATGRVPLEVVR